MKLEGKSKPTSRLLIRILRANGSIENKGVVCTKAVTDVYVRHLIDLMQAADATFSNYKYHDSGQGSTAPLASDTTLESPCGDSRDTGSQTEGASANIYRTVATHTYQAAYTITEHGVLNLAAVGKLLDRSTFTGIGIAINDRIEFTYELTIPSGG